MREWWSFFKERRIRAITIPHHPNTQSKAVRGDGKPVWGPVDWSTIDDEFQRAVEICQNRGAFEAPGRNEELRIMREDCGASVQAALAKGHRLGFIGSTDTHNGRPGTGTARCAIVSGDFSRAGLWDALYARSCYATTGAHILLFLDINGAGMGQELTVPNARTERLVRWRAVGTGPFKRVDLLRNNKVARSWSGGGKDDLSGRHEARDACAPVEWWYLRALQTDKEIAWSSPAWVSPKAGQ